MLQNEKCSEHVDIWSCINLQTHTHTHTHVCARCTWPVNEGAACRSKPPLSLFLLQAVPAMLLLLKRNIKRAEKKAIKLIFNRPHFIRFLCACVCAGVWSRTDGCFTQHSSHLTFCSFWQTETATVSAPLLSRSHTAAAPRTQSPSQGDETN